MADDADRAQKYEERERAAALARRKKYIARDDCAECGITLEPHRIYYGMCVKCSTYLEKTGNGGR